MAINDYIAGRSSFTTAEFIEMFHSELPGSARSTAYKALNKLCDSGTITRASRGHFITNPAKKKYSCILSNAAVEICAILRNQYPQIDFQILELYQMNEFVNFQLARNTIFVEVENKLDESVFHFLFERYPHVLFNPNLAEYYRYAGDETVVVSKLLTESPACYGAYRQASLEKLLVDLFGRGLSGSIISRSEYPAVYEASFEKYNINQPKMFRYARRRGAEKTIRDFISRETAIMLEA